MRSATFRNSTRSIRKPPAFSEFFRRRYETVRAVEDLSFEIHEGGVVGFLGPNGAVNATALKVLSGLLYPTEGEVTVCGMKLGTESNCAFNLVKSVSGVGETALCPQFQLEHWSDSPSDFQ